MQAHTYAVDTTHALGLRAALLSRPNSHCWVGWKPPDEGALKLNTDGSRLHSGHASAGGLLRDYLGHWLLGFTVNIGTTTSFEAELWGLLHGLRLCRSLGFTQFVVELDSASIVDLLNSATPRPTGVLSTLMLECYHLVDSLPNLSFCHTLREGNRAADFLANLGHSSSLGVTVFDSPPTGISNILNGDRMGIAFPRL